MNRTKLKAAVAEAKRFIARAQDYEANVPQYEFVGTKESGAVRRASMDLTRALADLRAPS